MMVCSGSIQEDFLFFYYKVIVEAAAKTMKQINKLYVRQKKIGLVLSRNGRFGLEAYAFQLRYW